MPRSASILERRRRSWAGCGIETHGRERKENTMSPRKKLICCCVAGCLLLVYLAGPGGYAGQRPNKAQVPGGGKLRALLEERYEILKTLVEAQKELARVGQSSTGKITEATIAMLRAEADLRSTYSRRIEIHEKIVTMLRECEARIAREAKRGMAGQDAVARVKLARLEAQIEIEKMKLAQQASQ